MLLEEEAKTNIDNQNNDIDITTKDSKSISLLKKIFLAVTGIPGLFVISLIVSLIVLFVNGMQDTPEATGITDFVTYGVLLVALCGILNKDIIKFKEDFKRWTDVLIGIAFGIGLIVIPILYNLLVQQFYPLEVSDNEAGIRSFIAIYPVCSVIFLGIVGPVCEELTYRVGLFGIFNNKKLKWLGYLLSILVFTFMHFNFASANIVGELINLPNYLICAVLLTVAYDKFGFGASLTAHSLNNLYAVIAFLITSKL